MLEKFDAIIDATKGVFFDRGDTTNASHQGPSSEAKEIQRAECLQLFIQKKYQKTISVDQILQTFIDPWKSTFPNRDRRGYELKIDDYINEMLAVYNIDYQEADINQMIFAYGKSHIQWDTPNHGISDLFQYFKAKNIKIGILSNSVMPGWIYQEMYKHYGLAQYIDEYVFSYDVGFRKPDRRIFEYACQKMTLAPQHCLMIGDRVDKDIMGAKQIGMRTIWYNVEKHESDNCNADLEISNFRELLRSG
ncbi:MAG: HAD family hydrolase [Leptolyngbyaceae cyanobacterium MO_188.B28]|nr:HAD family hydrolase [Leptolyngbyaceae cyanobacterium MO_188.B28]